MKLDRNINANGRGKYALLKLRVFEDFADGPFATLPPKIKDALAVLEEAGILDWGNKPETEFFVIRLKDQYASSALNAYATAAYHDDREYATEIAGLAGRSGLNSPFCQKPD